MADDYFLYGVEIFGGAEDVDEEVSMVRGAVANDAGIGAHEGRFAFIRGGRTRGQAVTRQVLILNT